MVCSTCQDHVHCRVCYRRMSSGACRCGTCGVPVTQYALCKPLQNLASSAIVNCQNASTGCGCSWVGRADAQRDHIRRSCWPLRFKEMEEEIAALKSDNSTLKRENLSLKEEVSEADAEIPDLQDSLNAKDAEIEAKEEEITNLKANADLKDTEITNWKADAEALNGWHFRVFHFGNALNHGITSLPPPSIQFVADMNMTYIPGCRPVATPPPPTIAPAPPVVGSPTPDENYGWAFEEMLEAAATQRETNEDDDTALIDLDAIMIGGGRGLPRRNRSWSRAPSPLRRAPWHKHRRM